MIDNKRIHQRFLEEVKLPRLLWYLFLSKTKLLKLFPKRKQASMALPLLTIALEEDPSGFISLLQDIGDETFLGNPKELKKKGADKMVEEVLELFPVLEPYRPYLLNYIRNKEKELREQEA